VFFLPNENSLAGYRSAFVNPYRVFDTISYS
jgi:hypothetical protein